MCTQEAHLLLGQFKQEAPEKPERVSLCSKPLGGLIRMCLDQVKFQTEAYVVSSGAPLLQATKCLQVLVGSDLANPYTLQGEALKPKGNVRPQSRQRLANPIPLIDSDLAISPNFSWTSTTIGDAGSLQNGTQFSTVYVLLSRNQADAVNSETRGQNTIISPSS